ncbi:TetR/AcrR family transcriptional regulator [Algicola sagamiensis]|uniref:TetR/AcrR family transcriptional regulator n=1 Tax=Algicola sagamiensis TaxID=163869 RepID=UPI00037138F8|nr:hypothetical protein [Algicola sagamiensis]
MLNKNRLLNQLKYLGRIPERNDGKQTRLSILNAALDILAYEGARQLRHRNIAQKANVPLASTTYYFKDIQQLMHDCFVYFVEIQIDDIINLQQKGLLLLEQYQLSGLQQTRQMAQLLTQHILLQISDKKVRLLEHAFRYEAINQPSLAALVTIVDDNQRLAIEELLTAMHIDAPHENAFEIHATILQLEYQGLTNPSTDHASWCEQILFNRLRELLHSKAKTNHNVLLTD